MHKIIFILLISCVFYSAEAQQIPLSNNNYVNKFIYNPAQIGEYSFTQTFFQARKQWVGIEGAQKHIYFLLMGA